MDVDIIDFIAILAMPWMANWDTCIAATVSHSIIRYCPFKTKMLASSKYIIWTLNRNRKAHRS